MLFALEFPPVSHLLEWPDILFEDTLFAVNKPVLIFMAALLLTLVFFFVAAKKRLVPSGAQNVAESAVNFIEDSVIMQTMGREGMAYLPFLLALFFFVLICNIFEVLPFIQFPATSRMAIPAFLALMVWVIYNFVGLKNQGLGYFKNVMFPPACRLPSCRWWRSSSSSRPSSCGPSLSPCDSSPTCWRATCCS